MSAQPPRFLIIRRDNIGDLVCTTPLLTALRQHYPDAWIGVLANSYNAPVLAGHPAIDAVFAYSKLKHRPQAMSAISALVARARMILNLRRSKIDDIILAAPARQSSALRFARWIAPQRIVGGESVDAGHEAERVFQQLRTYNIFGIPPACSVVAQTQDVEILRSQLPGESLRAPIGIHISARKPSQRWPAERFAAVARELFRRHKRPIFLFWSPGGDTNPLHPGDDEKARSIVDECPDIPLFPVVTSQLHELIAGLSLCREVICSDGGAMHLAAGLGKPIVCLFGNSSAERWHPWGVPYELLQPSSRDVSDVGVGDVVDAYERLLARTQPQCASSQFAPTPTSTTSGTASLAT